MIQHGEENVYIGATIVKSVLLAVLQKENEQESPEVSRIGMSRPKLKWWEILN